MCACASLMADSKSTSGVSCLIVFGARMSSLCMVEGKILGVIEWYYGCPSYVEP